MISKTIGYNGVHYFQTNPYVILSPVILNRGPLPKKKHLQQLLVLGGSSVVGREASPNTKSK